MYAPHKEIIFRRPPDHWINNEIKENIRIRNSLRLQYTRSKDLAILRRYKDVQNLVQNQIDHAKTTYYVLRFSQLRNFYFCSVFDIPEMSDSLTDLSQSAFGDTKLYFSYVTSDVLDFRI